MPASLQRPVSIITARGIRRNDQGRYPYLKDGGWIAHEPNYLTVFFPVAMSRAPRLGDAAFEFTIPTLKKLAILKSFEAGLEKYGADFPHQFGMSDDDPHNMPLIIEAMRDSKLRIPTNAFSCSIRTYRTA